MAVVRGEIAEGSAVTVDCHDGQFTFATETEAETVEVAEAIAA